MNTFKRIPLPIESNPAVAVPAESASTASTRLKEQTKAVLEKKQPWLYDLHSQR